MTGTPMRARGARLTPSTRRRGRLRPSTTRATTTSIRRWRPRRTRTRSGPWRVTTPPSLRARSSDRARYRPISAVERLLGGATNDRPPQTNKTEDRAVVLTTLHATLYQENSDEPCRADRYARACRNGRSRRQPGGRRGEEVAGGMASDRGGDQREKGDEGRR